MKDHIVGRLTIIRGMSPHWVNAHHQELAPVTEMLTSCFKIFKIHLPGFDDSRIFSDVLSSHQPMDPGGADGGSACPH